MIRDIVSTVIELLGLAAVVFGVALFDWRAAVIVGGLLLVGVGYTVGRPVAAESAKAKQ